MLAELFAHATTFGSLIQVPSVLADKLPTLGRLAEHSSQDLFSSGELQRLEALVRQAEILTRRYDAVVANPPYMGTRFHTMKLKEFLQSEYDGYDKDLFAAFIFRMLCFIKEAGYSGVMTSFVWMFLGSYELLRKHILGNHAICSLVQLHYDSFVDAKAHVCSFVIQKSQAAEYNGSYVRLADIPGSENQGPKTIEAIHNKNCGWFFKTCQNDYSMIPGSPIAYWGGEEVHNTFRLGKPLGEIAQAIKGLDTCDNDRFIRCWFEVSGSKTCFNSSTPAEASKSSARWFPYCKGGEFRRWAGNYVYVVDWENDGQILRNLRTSNGGLKARPQGTANYFHEGITFSSITSALFSARHMSHAIFGGGGSAIFPARDQNLILALLNSKLNQYYMALLNPSVNMLVGDLAKIPVIESINSREIASIVDKLVAIAIADWDSFERSWSFQRLPLMMSKEAEPIDNLEKSYNTWTAGNSLIIAQTRELEEKVNKLLIEAYGLGKKLTTEVPLEAISITINPSYRYDGKSSEAEKWRRFRRDTLAEFLSYATGCMMGRYSLDQPGLILADSRDSQDAQLAAYEEKVGQHIAEIQFKPDPDGIIPVLDGEWFEDDIVARTREFLAVSLPESSVAENLRFIEESLGKDIRKYFCSEFYKDHLQTYKKRPIYWMVQSPKKGFSCLIYLHRYTKDTLNQVLNNYFRPYLQKLEARLAQLGLDQLNDDLPTRERTAARKEAEKITKVLKECQAWEQDALLPLAQQRIELDLDDGVKVNYLKLQDVLAPIPGLAAKED